MIDGRKPIKGRGSAGNIVNRFEQRAYTPEGEFVDDEACSPETAFLPEDSKSIIAYNESPDIGYDASMNPYRGCEHGCIYCYARPTHEYLGFSAGLDFETKIMVKEKAPELLRRELASPRWRPQVVAVSGATDPYQPVERRLCLTRRCLEVFLEFRNPVAVVTKNRLVTRDVDLLGGLAQYEAASVAISLTTLDTGLSRILEPRTSLPRQRLETIETLSRSGIPVGTLVAPVIPGLTDHEIPSILDHAAEAGARFAACQPVRLPYGVANLFEQWLDHHFPQRKKKVLNHIRSMRGGRLNDARFGTRMTGEGPFAEHVEAFFAVACRKAGIPEERPSLCATAFRRPGGDQLRLFKEA